MPIFPDPEGRNAAHAHSLQPLIRHPQQPAQTLAVLGSIAFDQLEREGRREFRLGGVGTYAGLTAWKLGWKVQLMAHVPASDWPLLAPLEGMGPNRWLPSAARTVFVNREGWGLGATDAGAAPLLDPGRTQWLLSQSDPLRAEEAGEWLSCAAPLDWVHLGPLFPGDLDPALVALARSHCRVLSADLQGWVRGLDQENGVIPNWSPDREGYFQGLDWVKASVAEWAVVQRHGGPSPEMALQKYRWKGLLLSAGAQGGSLYLPGERLTWQAVAPTRMVQETGAGDVFMAAFMVFMLDNLASASVQAALDRAAALVSRHLGGTWLDAAALQLPALSGIEGELLP
jgi:sugar/nucleoside kinase (ribokinase family)